MKRALSPPPLRRALTFTIATLIGAAFVLVTVFNVAFHELTQTDRAQTKAAREILDRVQQTVAMDLIQGDAVRAARAIALYGTDSQLETLAVTDEHGRVLMSTRFADRGKPAAGRVADFDPVLFEQVRSSRRLLLQPGPAGDVLVGYAPLLLPPKAGTLRPDTAGVLFIRYDLERARAQAWREALSPTYWASTLIAVVVSAVLLLTLLNRWVSHPLRHLGARVSRLARGERDVVSDLRGNSEIANLGRHFDDLSRQIAASKQALERANRGLQDQVAERTRHLQNEVAIRVAAEHALEDSEQELRSVLEAVAEGVALWDGDGGLRYANPAFRRLSAPWPLVDGETRLADILGHLGDREGNTLADVSDLQTMLRQPPSRDHALVRLDAEDAPTRWFNLAYAPIGASGGGDASGLVVSLTDVTDIQVHSEFLAKMANFDRLTGLPNRNLLHDRMHQALAHSRRFDSEAAVCYLDLDGFKAVNDEHGHDAGDELLIEAAQRLLAEVRQEDTVARLGGDEFALLLGDLAQRQDCEPVLTRILESLSRPYRIGQEMVTGISASIGVTLYPSDDSDPDTLLRHADHAMYAAKRAGKHRYRWFSAAQERRVMAQEQTLAELENALLDGQLVLHYQPRVDCRHGRVTGAEGLIRWQHPILGTLPPGQFLPLIDDTDLALDIGDWVIAEALRQLADWRQRGLETAVSINVFARQLQQDDFVDRVAAQIGVHGGGVAHGLELELTENSALEGIANIAELVLGCGDLGVPMLLDHFGTGYSTFDQLLRIPSRGLKIDPSFVRDLLHNDDHRKLVLAIIRLSRSFERDVIAVGVEDPAQVHWLMQSGCDVMQGHCFAAPMPAAELFDWIREFRPDSCYSDPNAEDKGYAEKTATGV